MKTEQQEYKGKGQNREVWIIFFIFSLTNEFNMEGSEHLES